MEHIQNALATPDVITAGAPSYDSIGTQSDNYDVTSVKSKLRERMQTLLIDAANQEALVTDKWKKSELEKYRRLRAPMRIEYMIHTSVRNGINQLREDIRLGRTTWVEIKQQYLPNSKIRLFPRYGGKP